MSTIKSTLAYAVRTADEAPAAYTTTGAPRPNNTAQLPINTFDIGPRMVLDTALHWTWRNPLNLIPATLVALEVISVVSMMVR